MLVCLQSYTITFTWELFLKKLIFCSFLPESFRWLLTKNRFDDAERVLERISDFNDLPFPREEFNKVIDNSNKAGTKAENVEKSYSIIDIFRSRVLRKRSIIVAFIW